MIRLTHITLDAAGCSCTVTATVFPSESVIVTEDAVDVITFFAITATDKVNASSSSMLRVDRVDE